MPTSQENKVHNTFGKAMDQINNLQKVFRDEGMLAKAVVDIGGSQNFSDIQEAFDTLYGALEDAHYDAMGHLDSHEESVEEGLMSASMTDESMVPSDEEWSKLLKIPNRKSWEKMVKSSKEIDADSINESAYLDKVKKLLGQYNASK